MVGKASLALSGVPGAEDAVGRAWELLRARLQEGGPKRLTIPPGEAGSVFRPPLCVSQRKLVLAPEPRAGG